MALVVWATYSQLWLTNGGCVYMQTSWCCIRPIYDPIRVRSPVNGSGSEQNLGWLQGVYTSRNSGSLLSRAPQHSAAVCGRAAAVSLHPTWSWSTHQRDFSSKSSIFSTRMNSCELCVAQLKSVEDTDFDFICQKLWTCAEFLSIKRTWLVSRLQTVSSQHTA